MSEDSYSKNVPNPDHPISLDAPARIAVLGGGPIGLESALYGRFLGYQVDVFEKGEIADHVRQWGHVQLFTPFEMLSSKLGRGALEAQDPDKKRLDPDQLIDGETWRSEYLIPLSESDLLSSSIYQNSEVLSVSRVGFCKQQGVGDPDRQEEPFAVLWQDASGKENLDYYDYVIDATGNFAEPNNLGTGGIPALGEKSLIQKQSDRITFGVPKFSDSEIDWANGVTLLVGDGYSAATTAIGIDEIVSAKAIPGGRLVWLTNKEVPEAGPIVTYHDDPLDSRVQLTRKANEVGKKLKAAKDPNQESCLIDQATIVSVGLDSETGKVNVEYRLGEYQFPKMKKDRKKNHFQIQVDRIVVNAGYKPDHSINRELQWHQCYASEGPMAWAAATMDSGADCMTKTSLDATAILTTEQRFFVLGMKSFGRNSNFLYTKGLDQIRDTFCWIGGRANLNLYQS